MFLAFLAQLEPLSTSPWEYVFDIALRAATAIIVLAAVAALVWRWFVRDRWENAVRRAVNDETGDGDGPTSEVDAEALAEQVMELSTGVREHVTVVVNDLREDLEGHLDRIETLERTVQNGLAERMARVEELTEQLVAGQARIEGMMQIIVQQGKG